MVPGVVILGKAICEWIDGEKFLVMKSWNDHPDFPNSTSIIGNTSLGHVGGDREPDELIQMFYFDSRGVHRVYEVRFTTKTWEWWRDSEEFSQRFKGTFEGGGNTIVCQGEMRRNGGPWEDDIAMTYRRVR